MEKLQVEYIPIDEIIPYEKNPRKNDKAIDVVAKSIKEFGFNVPILLDKENIIIILPKPGFDKFIPGPGI